jgi:hypothetical protein
MSEKNPSELPVKAKAQCDRVVAADKPVKAARAKKAAKAHKAGRTKPTNLPRPSAPAPDIDAFRAQHLALGDREVATDHGRARVTVDDAESPLVWLARRRGRDGQAMILAHQLQAGERLRADFTRAHLMQRTTANWSNPMSSGGRGAGGNRAGDFTDATIAARQRVNQALDAVGPEFSGLLLDVCCFLKGLADLEHDRGWPARSAKVVLQLGLDRLARHYGYAAQAKGQAHAPIRTWLAEGAGFVVG